MPDVATTLIKNRDGSLTKPPPMAQAQTQAYLIKLFNVNLLSNFKQALNQMFDGDGKATGTYTQDNHAVWHASAGVPGKSSVTIFYYVAPAGQATIFAIGEHVGASSYRVSIYGQPAGDFTYNALIEL